MRFLFDAHLDSLREPAHHPGNGREYIRMKRSTHAFLGTLCTLIAAACSSTPETPQTPIGTVSTVTKEAAGSRVEARSAQVSATVESIDHDTRVATLRLADGRRVTVKASEQVRNLAQVNVGDQVNATYFESVVIQVRRPGDATPGVAAGVVSARAAEGEMPGAAEVDTITLTTTVVEIDRGTQTVTLENRDGTRQTVNVRNPAQFDHVAIGDLVEITFTEAVAISVERPVGR